MKTWYKYTFKNILYEYIFKLCIEFGDNIIERGYIEIQQKTGIQEVDTFDSIPMRTTKMLYPIIKIEETYGCLGCCNESLGQDYHMECPYGCLHVASECDFCKAIKDTFQKSESINSPEPKRRKIQ